MIKATIIATVGFLVVFLLQAVTLTEAPELTAIEFAVMISAHYGLGLWFGAWIVGTSK